MALMSPCVCGSGEMRKVEAILTTGRSGNAGICCAFWVKQGAARWRGVRPTVRGAMN